MAEDWAIFISTTMILLALGVITFYLIPIQANLWATQKDWLRGLRLRLLLSSVFIVAPAAIILANRLLREFGIESVYLSNMSAISIGVSYLGFAFSIVSIYIYKKKE